MDTHRMSFSEKSNRKVLPTTPSTSVNSRLSMSGKMMERPSMQKERGMKMYDTFFLEYTIMAEFLKFKENLIPGIYICPADKKATLWYGILFVREGIYQGGAFRFQVKFSDAFLDGECPRVIFSQEIYHPAINPDTGDLNVAAAFPNWRRNTNHVWQILQYAKDTFVKVNLDYAPLNEVAAKQWTNDAKAFEHLVAECVSASQDTLFEASDEDMNYIQFLPYQEDPKATNANGNL